MTTDEVWKLPAIVNRYLSYRTAIPLAQEQIGVMMSILKTSAQPVENFLDLGCGDGALLEHLVRQRQVKGRGIELSEQGVLACVRRGLSVRQGNLQEGLADYPDGSFDWVILSQTLPFLNDPAMVLREHSAGARHVFLAG